MNCTGSKSTDYMDFTEPDHVRQLRDSLERFVEREMPRCAAVQWDKDNYFPRDVFAKLATLGVFGLTVPEEYGGAGRDILATMVVIEELSRRSLAVSVPYVMGACYAGMNLAECATVAQRKALLPRVVNGSLLFAYGWTEPDTGADLASVKTRAVRHGDTIRVNGAKRFCSGAAISDYIYTLARTSDNARYKNLSLIMVPPTTKGVTITPIDCLGLKGAATADVTFDDVEVSLDNIMGGEEGWNKGWSMIVGFGLDVEKLEVAALAVGIARAAVDDAWDYACKRLQFGQPISTFQSIQHKLAEMKTQLHAARLVLYHAAWLANTQQRCGVETSMAKLFTTEVAKTVTLECQTIFGAYGYTKGIDTERYVRDALLLPIIGGSSAVQRNNVFKWSSARA